MKLYKLVLIFPKNIRPNSTVKYIAYCSTYWNNTGVGHLITYFIGSDPLIDIFGFRSGRYIK
jgi:hypothetical protein